MLSAQKLQNTLNEIKGISKLDLILYGAQGKIAAQTFEPEAGLETVVSSFTDCEAQQQSYGEYQLYKIIIDNECEYVLVTTGNVENSSVIGQMALCQIRNLILSKTEQFDRNNFIQNVLLGNIFQRFICSYIYASIRDNPEKRRN